MSADLEVQGSADVLQPGEVLVDACVVDSEPVGLGAYAALGDEVDHLEDIVSCPGSADVGEVGAPVAGKHRVAELRAGIAAEQG